MTTRAHFLPAALGFAAAAAIALTSVLSSALPGTARAAEGLPRTMAWTAYGTTSAGYAQAVAIGNMLKSKHGMSLRVLPGKNDVSRMTPLRSGRVDMCACGIAAYYAQEGVMLFARKSWGPQPIRVILTSSGTLGIGLATAADANIRTLADLRGKRVAWIRAGDALNRNAEAFLLFAGLGWDDVEKVQFSGFKESADGIINDQVDAATMATITPHASRIAASPRGLFWPPLPHDDEAAWARIYVHSPYWIPHVSTTGAEVSEERPWEGMTYPYPILVTNADYDADTVYLLLRAMDENYADYKDSAPGAAGWALGNQNWNWVMPIHEGTVRYLNEVGVWNAELQAHNEALIRRQEVLAEAWQALAAADVDEEAFEAEWMARRAAALSATEMSVVFN